MTKDRKNTNIYLVDLKYNHSMNYFEELYRDSIKYSYIEQEGYIDLKRLMAQLVSEKIKFRKFERNKSILTLKVEMLDEELEKLQDLIKEGKINILHDYIINNIKKI
jgi:hypothetical protein